MSKYKSDNIEIIKINLSTPVTMKSRCKKCGKHPNIYFYVGQPYNSYDPFDKIKDFDRFKSFIKRLNVDWYLQSSPKLFNGIGSFSYSANFKYFNPRLHRTKGDAVNYIEYLGCECYGDKWGFTDKGCENKPEHCNRRARGKYSKTFIY